MTGQLWVADVGQGALEEVDRVTLGGNYGWRCFEGTRNTGLTCGSPPNLLAPVAEYGRSVGHSITGGHVYRGSMIAPLVGRYVFGDFITHGIFNIAESTQPTLTVTGGGGSNSKSANITVTSAPPPPPVANFAANPTSGQAPLAVQFTDQSSGSITT